MDKAKLKAALLLRGENYAKLGELLGLSSSSIYRKIQTENFTRGEIELIKEHYNLSAEEVCDIFFTQKVS